MGAGYDSPGGPGASAIIAHRTVFTALTSSPILVDNTDNVIFTPNPSLPSTGLYAVNVRGVIAVALSASGAFPSALEVKLNGTDIRVSSIFGGQVNGMLLFESGPLLIVPPPNQSLGQIQAPFVVTLNCGNGQGIVINGSNIDLATSSWCTVTIARDDGTN